eukprot:5756174-Pleurochrysis_carterae.AAC.2
MCRVRAGASRAGGASIDRLQPHSGHAGRRGQQQPVRARRSLFLRARAEPLNRRVGALQRDRLRERIWPAPAPRLTRAA